MVTLLEQSYSVVLPRAPLELFPTVGERENNLKPIYVRVIAPAKILNFLKSLDINWGIKNIYDYRNAINLIDKQIVVTSFNAIGGHVIPVVCKSGVNEAVLWKRRRKIRQKCIKQL